MLPPFKHHTFRGAVNPSLLNDLEVGEAHVEKTYALSFLRKRKPPCASPSCPSYFVPESFELGKFDPGLKSEVNHYGYGSPNPPGATAGSFWGAEMPTPAPEPALVGGRGKEKNSPPSARSTHWQPPPSIDLTTDPVPPPLPAEDLNGWVIPPTRTKF